MNKHNERIHNLLRSFTDKKQHNERICNFLNSIVDKRQMCHWETGIKYIKNTVGLLDHSRNVQCIRPRFFGKLIRLFPSTEQTQTHILDCCDIPHSGSDDVLVLTKPDKRFYIKGDDLADALNYIKALNTVAKIGYLFYGCSQFHEYMDRRFAKQGKILQYELDVFKELGYLPMSQEVTVHVNGKQKDQRYIGSYDETKGYLFKIPDISSLEARTIIDDLKTKRKTELHIL